jgi:bifunctional non-homologous end joining protein LigD
VITHSDLAELATLALPFNRPGWIFELKYDGFRMLATHYGDQARLISRRGTDYSDRFPELIAELLKLPEIALDTELVMLEKDGRPSFERLIRRRRMKRRLSIEHAARTEPAALIAF